MINKLRNKGILFLLLIMLSNVVFGQIDTIRFNKAYFKKYWIDTKGIVTSPARWQQRDWVKLGILITGTASLTLADQSVADFFQSHQNKTETYISANFLEHFGAEHSILLMSGIFTYGILAKNKRSVSTALLALESFALASLVTRIPKTLAGRQRPDNWQGDGPYTFKGPFNGTSFPSGHTTASFAVASVIATQYRDIKWIPVAAYSVASLAGISRIYDNKHWLSDVVAGAVIGTVVGNFVSHRSSDSKLSVIPFGNSNYQGVKLSYIW
ncbi:MAG: phosphatase PAP2 family protein [Bacteroidota bacterium]|nr:phosphatase PAP2 family protein [Bacteroidota bacterium]